MKILEIAPFSAGICGVWARVLEESKRFSEKGYEVQVFSSNATKGCDKKAKPEENIGKIKIKRFPFIKLIGESFMHWNFEKQALEYKPDIIIVHNYRHLHTTKALKAAEILRKQGHKCKVFLVTHAPFVKGNITRGFLAKLLVNLYDKYLGPRTINKFDRIITISRWEMPYLSKMHALKSKIEYIPNGISDEFFMQKKIKSKKDVLFLGRIASIKNLEVLIRAAKLLPEINFSVVGPAEKAYLPSLLKIIKEENITNIRFYPPVYDIKKKIKLIDEHRVFVLTSIKESMPQSLLEAMSRGKIVISSETEGGKELIKNRKNGFLFKIGDYKQLAELIKENIKGDKDMQNKAIKEARNYSWAKMINSYISLFNK